MARRHFPGGLDSGEADGKAGLHKHSRASGLKIRAKRRKKQQPWALEGPGNSLLMQTHWLTSQRLPTILSACQETPPPRGRGTPSCSLVGRLVHRNHRDQASVRVVLQAHPCRGNQYKKHRPASPSPSKSLEEASTQAPSGGVRSPAAQAGQQGAVLSAPSAHGHSPWPRTPGLSLPGSRPTASLAAPEMPTPPAQCTPAPQPSPWGGGEIASTPRSEAQKGTRVLRSSAARTAIHQGPVAAARL